MSEISKRRLALLEPSSKPSPTLRDIQSLLGKASGQHRIDTIHIIHQDEPNERDVINFCGCKDSD